MAPSSLKRNIQSFKSVAQKLQAKLEQLRRKREDTKSRAFVVLEENKQEERNLEEQDPYQTDVSSLVVTATDILIEILELKLAYVQEALRKLSALVHENLKIATPPELSFSRYEEWVDSNQRLFELNSQLFDLENLKFEIRQRQIQARQAIAKGDHLSTGSQFIHSSVERIQSFLTRFRFPADATSTTQNYLHDLLSPRGARTTIEAEKVQEYVTECMQYKGQENHDGKVHGAHPQRYHQFMAVLCGYIIEKQREWQGEEISYELVHTTVEHHLMPQIKSAVLKFVSHPDKDATLRQQCERFSNVTLGQLKVKAQLQSGELVPFIDSITQLRASYFSPNPTDKMYSIVAAAKALYDQLGMMGEMSIDGDSFLDLWIYIILKANMRDLATNFHFMAEYGNPQLAKDEAGYYLTTLEAAVTFIEILSPDQLTLPASSYEFVVCEAEKFSQLAELPSSCFEVVRREEVMEGYRVAVIQEWALNRARLFTTALLSTRNPEDCATVSVIRLRPEHSSTAHVQYFAECFTNPGRDLTGLYCGDTPLGQAVLVDMANCNPQNVIALPSGNFDVDYPTIERVLQLIRLDSQGKAGGYDSCIIPSSPPNPIPIPQSQNGMDTAVPDTARSAPLNESHTHSQTHTLAIPTGHHSKASSVYDLDTSTSSLRSSSPYFLSLNVGSQRDANVGEKGSSSSTATLNTQPTASEGVQQTTLNRYTVSVTPEPSMSTVAVQVEIHDTEVTTDQGSLTPSQLHRSQGTPHDALHVSSHGDSSRPGSTVTHSGSSNLQTRPLHLGALGIENTNDFGASVSTADDSICLVHPHLASPQNILSHKYAQELEANFVRNHLYGDASQSLDEAMVDIIRQGQMYLQRLNYLSVMYKVDGVYTDNTLQAVRRFQKAHNIHESKYSVVLPENGYLTSPTYQYLRQAFLTIYASVLRLGLDRDLGENFNPMSSSDDDIAKFQECVTKFQRRQQLLQCQQGTLCPNTIDKIRHVLRMKRHTIG